jgi:hypothetical protein
MIENWNFQKITIFICFASKEKAEKGKGREGKEYPTNFLKKQGRHQCQGTVKGKGTW